MTLTATCNGAPGIGVQGVGVQTSGPFTNGTVTVAEPAAMALSWAVNVAPAEWLESTDTTLLPEISGGPATSRRMRHFHLA